MKARPILFSAPMVRALIAGTKTQTRRTMKPQPLLQWPAAVPKACPYGQPGDLLWVRETWREDSPDDPEAALYLATDKRTMPTGFKWKPSIFMPRWASRLTLELTEVRVERLTAISENDAAAEGIVTIERSLHRHGRMDGYGIAGTPPDEAQGTRAYGYAALWDSINGHGAWAKDPWVWALTFRVHRKNVDDVLKEKGEH